MFVSGDGLVDHSLPFIFEAQVIDEVTCLIIKGDFFKLIKGKIETKDAYCVNAIINTMLRATESDLEERVKRIERDIEAKAH